MTTVVVIQARTGSSRLPGKVLADLDGRPLLTFLLERLAPLPWPVVVATSTEARDDRVVDLAEAAGVHVVRGPEHDVLRRFVLAARATRAGVVVRLTADCPLLDPAVIEAVVAAREATGADYASNTVVRCFPDGLDVEAVTTDALQVADLEAVEAGDREHVTPFIWSDADRFAVTQVVTDPPHGLERWTVDLPPDLERVRAMVARCTDAVTDWRRMLHLVGATEPPGRMPVDGVDTSGMTLVDIADLTTDHQPTHGALT